jgi:hypothetical protein
MAFLGDYLEQGDLLIVRDDNENQVGQVDLGHATVIDAKGSTIAGLTNIGEANGNAGTFIGQFEGFSYRDLPKSMKFANRSNASECNVCCRVAALLRCRVAARVAE